MKVGVPTEIKTDEYRVSLTPAGVSELVERGHEVYIQAGAGVGSTIPDEEYEAQGAHMLPDAQSVFDEAEMILGVKEPQPEEVGDAAAGPPALHLPAPGARPRAHARARGVGRHLRRLRDRGRRARPAAAARADERGGRQDRHPGGRVLPGAPARRARRAARRRAGRGRRDRDGHRRRGGGARTRPSSRSAWRPTSSSTTATSTACASSTWPSAGAPRPSTPRRSRSRRCCRAPTS